MTVELYSEAFFADPIAYYDHLRDVDPIHFDEANETWIVTRYADVAELTRRHEQFSSELSRRDSRPPNPPIPAEDLSHLQYVSTFRLNEFIQADPPDHGPCRAAVAERFSGRRLESLRPMVRSVIEGLLDAVAGEGAMDVLTAVGRPLPLLVIARLLGIEDDALELADQAKKRMASVLTLDAQRMRISADGFRETAEHLNALLDSGRFVGTDTVLGDTAAAELGGTYSRQDSLANLMLLIDAGHETTTQLVCNGTLTLLRHPDQWAVLVDDPAGVAATAVEECLRYDPPLHAFRRIAAADVELSGRRIRAGDAVLGIIASANWDPQRFDDPERFDVRRRPNPHLAFGAGPHYCLGQYLARMEGQEYLKAVATRFPDLHLAPGVRIEYFSTPRVRSMTALPVQWAVG